MTFAEIFNQFGIDYRDSGHHHCRVGWIQIDCPFCSKGWRKYRLGFNLVSGRASCWACGPKSVHEVFHEITGRPYSELRRVLANLVRETAPTKEKQKRGKLITPPAPALGPLKKQHKEYLKERNFDPLHIEKLWGIQGLNQYAGMLSWRIFIPITYRGEIVSWTSRAIDDENPDRYISAKPSQEVFPHKTLLYGEDYCRDTIVICEGPTDVWKIGPSTTCTFGTSFKREQVLKMAQYPKRVICFDNEKEGQIRASELARLLAPFDGETFNVQLDAKDPGSASNREINRFRKAFGISID